MTTTKGYDFLNRRTNNSSGSTTAFTVNTKNELTNGPYSTTYYDSNGNPTSDNSHSYTWDDENQLTQVLWGGGNYRTEFTYDGRLRLRVRKEYYKSGPYWILSSQTSYVYDGMRVIQERDYSNNPLVVYTRGHDLSGTLEGAGGIGGLLVRSHGYSSGSWSTHNYYHADGGGNVTYLVNSSQTLAASYRYDPFGNTISSSGTLASANVYRFSSKEWIYDGGNGYYYYGYRFYFPNLQRWANRDPLDEDGHRVSRAHGPTRAPRSQDLVNLFAFVGNRSLQTCDPDGLQIVAVPFIACIEIARRNYNEMKDLAEKGQGGIYLDLYFHCLTSCQLADLCGSLGAKIMGNMKEWLSKDPADSAADQAANAAGRYCGTDSDCKNTTCHDCCEQQGYLKFSN